MSFSAQALGMFFDDDAPYRHVQALCSLSCAVCAAAPPGASPPPPPPFHTLPSLAHHLRAAHKQHMCDICLQSRKIFVSQQHLYTKVRQLTSCAFVLSANAASHRLGARARWSVTW